MEQTDPGFDFSVLSEFRTRLVSGSAEQRLLHSVLDCCRQRGWLKARGRQRTDSTQGLTRVRAVNRLECVTEDRAVGIEQLDRSRPGLAAGT